MTVVQTETKPAQEKDGVCLSPCPIERGMRIIGGKWKGSILWHLQDGPMRFNALARQLGGASKKMVDQRLKEMEQQGLVSRQVLSTRPIAVAYEITPFGRSSLAILEQLKDWAEANEL
ncbi:transcriptional regulator [Microbulbifer flavimaris]|uniref:Transcriptional regulator n=1 Tax=Microbulbifer flavimaris TaxID=1781068 RepID=A0ABX4HXX5_9GAMM|nr:MULTISPECIES: helix-turn-helix domain-containing protein [Microbulbifer]KUJ82746.1 transcriptional regulator [Microbulbifer sp. ZGT114]PCO04921.1 transcriptional regulator [Microbulbifer flavimaris]